jgi:hypothetical protein
MKFARMGCLAAIAGTFLAGHAAQAQDKAAEEAKARKFIASWTSAMTKANQDEFGAARKKKMEELTETLSQQLWSVQCDARWATSSPLRADDIAGEVERAAKIWKLPITFEYKPTCSGGSLHGKIEKLQLAKQQDDEDKASDEAEKYAGPVDKALSLWGGEIRKAYDEIGQPQELRKKIDSINRNYEAAIHQLKCTANAKTKFNFNRRADEEKKKPGMPKGLVATGGCGNDNLWYASLTATAATAEQDEKDVEKGASEAARKTWSSISGAMFPAPKSFSTDAQKKAYVAKFANGEFAKKLAPIECKPNDKTTEYLYNAINEKKKGLSEVFEFSGSEPVTCKDGHVALRLSAAMKPAANAARKDDKTKANGAKTKDAKAKPPNSKDAKAGANGKKDDKTKKASR